VNNYGTRSRTPARPLATLHQPSEPQGHPEPTDGRPLDGSALGGNVVPSAKVRSRSA
jgi:hypothetical protein